MTPKEKAKELVDKHKTLFKHYDANPRLNIGLHNYFKKSALLAVDEIINEIYKSSTLDKYYLNNDTMNVVEAINYYNEVKQEIQLL